MKANYRTSRDEIVVILDGELDEYGAKQIKDDFCNCYGKSIILKDYELFHDYAQIMQILKFGFKKRKNAVYSHTYSLL